MTWALVTLLAPSVKAIAPAALSRPISAISSPRSPLVSAAIGCTWTIAVARAAQDEVDDGGIIDRRRGVGLAHDGRDAAGGRRLAGRRNGLAILRARLAHEGGHVDQAGRGHLAPA